MVGVVMAHFDSELTVTQLSGKRGEWRRWRLHEDLVYETGTETHPRHVVVPAGFISDGPTIPRFLWVLLPVWGSYGRAGVLHDYLWSRIAIGDPHPEAPDRKSANRVFFEAMIALGVGWITRRLIFSGVGLGRWFHAEASMLHHNRKLLKVQKADPNIL